MATACAPCAGADLAAARQRLGRDLDDLAADLRIRVSYLEDLEAGRLHALPGPAYAQAFLRSYAGALGLDVEEVCRRFRTEAGERPKPAELVFPTPVPERGLPAGALILLGLILVGGAYTGWYRLSGEGRLPAESITPVPARLASLADQALPGPDGRVTAAPLPSVVPPRVEDNGEFEPRHAASENPLLMPEPPPPAPAPIEEIRSASIPGATATTAIAMPVPMPLRQPDIAAQTPGVSANAAVPDNARLLLRFTGDTWVQVRERGGQALVTRVMKAGDTFAVPVQSNLVLNTGNAGSVEIVVDGSVVPSIGGPGAVRKDVPLDPDLLKAGPAAPVATRR